MLLNARILDTLAEGGASGYVHTDDYLYFYTNASVPAAITSGDSADLRPVEGLLDFDDAGPVSWAEYDPAPLIGYSEGALRFLELGLYEFYIWVEVSADPGVDLEFYTSFITYPATPPSGWNITEDRVEQVPANGYWVGASNILVALNPGAQFSSPSLWCDGDHVIEYAEMAIFRRA